MKLNELDLLSLQTKFMQGDITTQGFCYSLDTPMKTIANNIEKALLWFNYENATEDILDAMALSLNIPWYDGEADINTKKYIIRKADEVKLFLGTSNGIKLVFEAWDVTIYILEWFNYNGAPYHYKIVIDYTTHEALVDSEGKEIYDKNGLQIFVLRETPFLPDGELISKLTSLLPLLQPVRCVLDSITTTENVDENTYGDIEGLGNYSGLVNRFYWDLQYQV